MKLKLTLTPEAAAAIKEMYENGELEDIGVLHITEIPSSPTMISEERYQVVDPPSSQHEGPLSRGIGIHQQRLDNPTDIENAASSKEKLSFMDIFRDIYELLKHAIFVFWSIIKKKFGG